VTDVEPTFTFLSAEDVLSLHEDAIDAWGGTHGIRDRGLLESAVGAAMNVALYDPPQTSTTSRLRTSARFHTRGIEEQGRRRSARS
jgi:hypothetical protein